jgi:leucyl-tRNA synthetase
MICVNELTELKCHKKEVLQDLVVLLASYAPHIAEELWTVLGNTPSVSYASFPQFKEEFIQENSFEYPVSFNGKMRFKLELPKSLTVQEIEKQVLADDRTGKWTDGKQIRKVIVVPNKIINIVHS